jgi:chromosome segregation ATPase
MSEDLTQKLPKSNSDTLGLILTTVQSLDKRLEKLEHRVENIESRLQHLEEKVEERLHDTRPIWQKIVTDIAEVRAEVHDIRTSQRDGLRRMSVFHDTLISMQADYRDIYDRVRGLEINPNQQNSST